MTQTTESGCMIWLTGLSGAGKSTLAQALHQYLTSTGQACQILDGDLIRPHLCKGLGFTAEDRAESVRRIAFVGKLLVQHGVVVVVPVIAPYRAMRNEIREDVESYIEVFVNAPLAVCEARDPKGLYQRARSGQLQNFTGVSDPYEEPLSPDVECRTDLDSVETCVENIVAAMELRQMRHEMALLS